MTLTNIALRGLNWRGGLAMLGFAALLPLMPTWARAQQPGGDKKGVIELKLDDIQLNFDNSDGDKAKAELEKLKAALKKKQAEVAELEARLKAAAGHGGKTEVKKPGEGKPLQFELKLGEGQLVFGEPKKAPPIPEKPGVMKIQLGDGKVLLLQTEGLKLTTNPAKPAPAAPRVLFELVPGEKGTFTLRSVTPPAKPGAELPKPEGLHFKINPGEKKPEVVQMKVIPIPPNAGADKRVEQAEKRINELINELEKLKRDLRSKPGQPGGQPKVKEEAREGGPLRIQVHIEGADVKNADEAIKKALEALEKAKEKK